MNNNIIDIDKNKKNNINDKYNEQELNMYEFDCIAGCGEKTNGSQYCCKTYCYKEKYDNDNDNDNDNELPRKKIKKSLSTAESINQETINLLLDNAWTTIEKLSNIKRPDNWLTINNL